MTYINFHRNVQRGALLAAAIFLGVGLMILLLTLPEMVAAIALPNLQVDTVTDSNDLAYQQCTTAPNDCSLRGAISRANANATITHTITLPAGTFTLTLAGAGEDGNATGDLDVSSGAIIIIVGDAAGSTVQAGADADSGIDRVFHVQGRLVLQNVTVRYGRASDIGGGILNAGTLELMDVTLFANIAGNSGGGLYVDGNGQTAISGGQVVSNTASASGGGLTIGSGAAVLSGTQILSNTADISGGGVFVWLAASQLQATNVLIQGNRSPNYGGGGLFVESGKAILTNTQVISNSAPYGGGVRVNQASAVLAMNGGLIQNNFSSGNGGGLIMINGSASLLGVQFLNNHTGGGGGALYVNQGSISLSDAQIISNSAKTGAGVQIQGGGSVTLTNPQILSNTAATSGGGVYVWSGILTIGSGSGPGFAAGSGSIISGNRANASIGGGIYNSTGSLILNDLTIANNYANANGGGIFANSGSATLVRVQVRENQATFLGGGLYSALGTVTVQESLFADNQAAGGGGIYMSTQFSRVDVANSVLERNQGGGITMSDGAVTIANSQLLSNTQSSGGGLYVGKGTAVLTGTQLISNTAVTFGGAIMVNQAAAFTLTNSSLDNNRAGTSGGGLFVESSPAVLDNVHIGGNFASYGGGLRIRQTASVLTLTNSVIEQNGATLQGGGLYLTKGSSSIAGVTINNNNAPLGGGVFIGSGTAVLTNTQILSNSASSDGGGVYANNNTAAITLTNSILADNMTDKAGGGVYVKLAAVTLDNSRILNNTAVNDGGGLILNGSGSVSVTNGCIVNNSDTGVSAAIGAVTAAGAWWGAADGPAGVGPGGGDSVSSGVDYSGFQTSAPAGCPDRQPPVADAGSGQSVGPGAVVTLDGSASAALHGGALAYFWQQTGGAAVSFTPTLSRAVFTAPSAAGVLTFTLTVTDAMGRASAVDVTTVTVSSYAIYLPVIIQANASDQRALANPHSYAGNRSDPKGFLLYMIKFSGVKPLGMRIN